MQNDMFGHIAKNPDMLDDIFGEGLNPLFGGSPVPMPALENSSSSEECPECSCPVCAGGYSRAYLRHLFMAEEILAQTLTSLHNLWHYQSLLLDIRRAIRDDCWSSLFDSWRRWVGFISLDDGSLIGSFGFLRVITA